MTKLMEYNDSYERNPNTSAYMKGRLSVRRIKFHRMRTGFRRQNRQIEMQSESTLQKAERAAWMLHKFLCREALPYSVVARVSE